MKKQAGKDPLSYSSWLNNLGRHFSCYTQECEGRSSKLL